MKTRRISMAVISCVLAVAVLPAASYGDILRDAKENSTQIGNSRLNYENTMLNLASEDEKDEAVWSVTGTVNPYVETVYKKDLGETYVPGSPFPKHEYKDVAGIRVPVLNASVTLPNDGRTNISIDAPFAVGYDDAYFSINPAVRVSHTFDFSPKFESAFDDLQDAKSHITAEASLSKSEIAFENTLISYFKQFITLEKNIKLSEKALDDRNTVIEKMETLRTATQESLTYRKAVLDRDKAERDLENLHAQKELLKRQYKAVTGLEWDGIKDIPEADLRLEIQKGGNSSVLSSSLDSQIAYENLRKAEFKTETNSLSVGGGVSASLNTADIEDNSYKASVNSTYRIGDNLSFTADVSLPFKNTFKPDVPTVSIKGTWSSAPSKGLGGMNGGVASTGTNADEDTLKKLQNNVTVAENNYRDALQDYENDGYALQNDISSYLFNLQKAKDDTEYTKSVLELEELSFEKGLNSQKDVDKARFDYEMRQYDEALVKLDGLLLQNRIRTYSI